MDVYKLYSLYDKIIYILGLASKRDASFKRQINNASSLPLFSLRLHFHLNEGNFNPIVNEALIFSSITSQLKYLSLYARNC